MGLIENGKLTPSPVAPATGCLCCFSARRQEVRFRPRNTSRNWRIVLVTNDTLRKVLSAASYTSSLAFASISFGSPVFSVETKSG
jgi:hypothetical protein